MSSGIQTAFRVPRPTMELEGVTSFPTTRETRRFQASIGRAILSNSSLAFAQKFQGKAFFARPVVQLGGGGGSSCDPFRWQLYRPSNHTKQFCPPTDGAEVLHSAAVNDYRCFQFSFWSDSGQQIDLFVSNESAQVETYFSLVRRDKLSTGTNALN